METIGIYRDNSLQQFISFAGYIIGVERKV